MKILFATAELAPFVKVGGLGDFSAGLVRALRSDGFEVEVLLPDYGNLDFAAESEEELAMPVWS
jgi:starch synthase